MKIMLIASHTSTLGRIEAEKARKAKEEARLARMETSPAVRGAGPQSHQRAAQDTFKAWPVLPHCLFSLEVARTGAWQHPQED